ncbi:phosphoglucomutase/phosphomannomutase PgmG [Sphingomonas sp. IC4-52]|uniref:phosphoglucomutase/phosphomannomutase PgmG n=1 Tax=Sphingomonas sp. IC4-52 TaxID=2887202 RepID=UPI001D106081|nr:phosphomannomutase/phosphoglucomutase [Sphingomonas sp. IC4-52]MCC2979808.1 phosphomannomutase/phosphoglucomutase [Sphingomonas sp. IC4-52]
MRHRLPSSILREYDIRGTVGQSLSAPDAMAIGRAFGSIVRRGGGARVVVGRDGRLSSPMLEAALVDGLLGAGIDVVRIGVGPSPMLYHAERHLDVDGGIQVTGSHNPRDDNGFKMVLGHRPFFGSDITALAALSEQGDVESGAGRVSERAMLPDYVGRLAAADGLVPLRIAWDAGNGAAGPAIERLVRLLPGEHHLLFTDVDGNFPNHHPDPTEEANLADLKALVARERLDLGVAFDGDGDRIGAVDGEGRVIAGDQLLSILAGPVLRERPGAAIVADVKASGTLFDHIAELGGRPVMWKSGHSNIKTMMHEVGAPLAGEMSGHIFFGELGGHDDALYAAIQLIRAIGASGKTLAALRDAMPKVVATPELRFPVDEARREAVVQEVLARLAADGAEVDRTDGARVTTADGWWLLRASNTQAMLTARAEARDQGALDRLVAAIDRQLALSGVSRIQ